MLRVLIVDDEPLARQRLRRLLQPYADAGRLTVCGEAADGMEALRQIAETQADLVFLDVQMPEMDGFEVVEHLNPTQCPFIVFATAYDEYAIQAFEANAMDYLVKPIERKRLATSIERAEGLQSGPPRHAHIQQLLDYFQAEASLDESRYLQKLSIPYRGRHLVVDADRIISAEIADGITRLFLVSPKGNLKQHMVNYTLDQLEQRLDPAEFVRVHRSAIVRLGAVREMIPWFSGRLKLIMDYGHEVIASRERGRSLRSRLSI